MEKKQRIILACFILVIVIVITLIAVFFKKRQKPEEVITPDNQQENNEVIAKPITKEQNERTQIISTASSFVEIYGTYSNSDNYNNIQTLYPFMTDKIKKQYSGVIENSVASDVYYSKVTQVLSSSLMNYKNGDTAATAVISVVEKVTNSSYEEDTVQKRYVVKLIKDSNKWKVDEVKENNVQ